MTGATDNAPSGPYGVRMLLRKPVSVVALAAVAALALAGAADARRPVVAYVDQAKKLHLYDTQTGAEVPAPALTIADSTRGFAMSLNGRFVVYTDPAGTHLFDRADSSDKLLAGVQGAPRSVSDAGMIATDGADNGPAKLFDRTGAPVPTGFDDANGSNQHRMSHISGDGRFLATTCNMGNACIADSGGDSDLYVQDVGAMKDTALADDALTGKAGQDNEHPCINGDGSLVGADSNVAPNNHDIAVYDRAAGKALDLSAINTPGSNLTYCALDTTGGYIGFGDGTTGAASVYERSTGTFLSLPPNTVATPIWLTQPYAPPTATVPGSGTPDATKVLGKLTSSSVSSPRGAVVTVRFTMARRVSATVRSGLATYQNPAVIWWLAIWSFTLGLRTPGQPSVSPNWRSRTSGIFVAKSSM